MLCFGPLMLRTSSVTKCSMSNVKSTIVFQKIMMKNDVVHVAPHSAKFIKHDLWNCFLMYANDMQIICNCPDSLTLGSYTITMSKR